MNQYLINHSNLADKLQNKENAQNYLCNKEFNTQSKRVSDEVISHRISENNSFDELDRLGKEAEECQDIFGKYWPKMEVIYPKCKIEVELYKNASMIEGTPSLAKMIALNHCIKLNNIQL